MKYKYKIFGYHVTSEIELDAYSGDFDLNEITIEQGSINKAYFGIAAGGVWFSQKEKHITFYIPEIGAYEIIDGNKIIVEPEQGAKDSAIQLYLLGSAFGFLMHQRGSFPLHGSTVDLGSSCLTLVGHSGAGKSSLASGFVENGFKLLTDDVSRIDLCDGIRCVFPSYPSQKIWQDVVTRMGIDYNPENRIINRLDKFYVNNRERFSQQVRPLKAVIEITPAEVAKPLLVRLEKREVLNSLIAHSYRQEMMGNHTDLKSHLQFCSELAMAVPVYRLLRPLEGFTVKAQIQAIDDEIGIYGN